MHLKLGSDIFDSFRRYQTRILREYDRMTEEFRFVTVDAQQPIDGIQQELRATIGRYLAGESMPRQGHPGPTHERRPARRRGTHRRSATGPDSFVRRAGRRGQPALFA